MRAAGGGMGRERGGKGDGTTEDARNDIPQEISIISRRGGDGKADTSSYSS